MSWARKGIPGSDDLVEYEARLNIEFRAVPTTGLCQYDARIFDGETL
jgi:MEDS: MEthanogen/methylotroph, DcmR Sensory domain